MEYKIVDNKSFDKVITPAAGLFNFNIKRVIEYRDLIGILVKRDFVLYYKQTIFGPLWYLVEPIISAITYMIIFGNLANLGTDGIPQLVFYFSGTMLWTFFSTNVKDTSDTFVKNKQVFGKIYFPRIIAPIAASLVLMIKLGLQFALFVIMYGYYTATGVISGLSWHILMMPFIVLWIAILSMGIGMIVASITTKYRDIAMALTFFLQLCMYITPVVYPLSQVPKGLRIIFYINPLTAPLEYFRHCFFLTEMVSTELVVSSIIVTVVVFFLGILSFNKNERTFVDMI